MASNTMPPEHISEKLTEAINIRYGDMMKEHNIRMPFPDIAREQGKYHATVTFWANNGHSFSALFRYETNSSEGTSYWYCYKDWND
ncbi:TPA: hypothetical protein ACGU4U_004335 [Vibrio vulnificus]